MKAPHGGRAAAVLGTIAFAMLLAAIAIAAVNVVPGTFFSKWVWWSLALLLGGSVVLGLVACATGMTALACSKQERLWAALGAVLGAAPLSLLIVFWSGALLD